MSVVSAQTKVVIVSSALMIHTLLDDLTNLAINPPSLYLDLGGVSLGRHGSLSVISLYIAPIEKIYLIDIYLLGEIAFSTTNSSTTSLKTILESSAIPKVIFDIRNDSDALFGHFQISVDGIEDLQLMELATRKGSKDFVAGLAKCIERDSLVSVGAKVEWQRTKENARRLYNPKEGGRYEVFNERPSRPEIVQYCAWDVALLPGLYNIYNAKLRLPGERFWQVQVRKATKDRVKLSQSASYDGQAKTKVNGPWDKWYIEQAIEAWNEDIMFEAMHGDGEDNDFDDFGDNDNQNEDFDYHDTARDCIGWEEDMEKNGEYF